MEHNIYFLPVQRYISFHLHNRSCFYRISNTFPLLNQLRHIPCLDHCKLLLRSNQLA
uniref:Uncharacterized protein n=1 Tax=Lepeophtheirus salmonis TaxID=72036 RepID=A0A0K2TZC5_LEPSM